MREGGGALGLFDLLHQLGERSGSGWPRAAAATRDARGSFGRVVSDLARGRRFGYDALQVLDYCWKRFTTWLN